MKMRKEFLNGLKISARLVLFLLMGFNQDCFVCQKCNLGSGSMYKKKLGFGCYFVKALHIPTFGFGLKPDPQRAVLKWIIRHFFPILKATTLYPNGIQSHRPVGYAGLSSQQAPGL
jgi:hypothetical protein